MQVLLCLSAGRDARPCGYEWILDIRGQCIAADVAFRFHQTGAHSIKDGKTYRVPRRFQLSQAHKATICICDSSRRCVYLHTRRLAE
ncbi:MAG: DUF5131 family protein [Bacteroidales bacterium]|nr:DUF5131 family protein [Bacteroidales bacterium]